MKIDPWTTVYANLTAACTTFAIENIGLNNVRAMKDWHKLEVDIGIQ